MPTNSPPQVIHKFARLGITADGILADTAQTAPLSVALTINPVRLSTGGDGPLAESASGVVGGGFASGFTVIGSMRAYVDLIL